MDGGHGVAAENAGARARAACAFVHACAYIPHRIVALQSKWTQMDQYEHIWTKMDTYGHMLTQIDKD